MSVEPLARTFACLDARSDWAAARTSGLERDPCGALRLERVPALASGATFERSGPYAALLEGFAASAGGELFFSVPAEQRLVRRDPRACDAELGLDAGACPGELSLATLGSLAVAGRQLFAADERAGRLFVLALPGLELSASWGDHVGAPARLAVDALGRVYVLDRSAGRLLRLDPQGRRDRNYDARAGVALTAGLDLFVAGDGTAFVSVDGTAALLCFSPEGAPLPSVSPPAEAPGFRPGALAGDGHRLYVADRAAGALWTYARDGRSWLGPLPAFRAPVFGLATDGAGHLYVRTSAGTDYVELSAGGACVARGKLEAGPFDAGEQRAWLRVHVEATLPPGTRARLATALADSAIVTAPLAWSAASQLDMLVQPPTPPDAVPSPAARFLWLRVTLESDEPAQTPSLALVLAETPGEDPLALLPAVYARADAAGDGYLRAWLTGLHAELADRERDILGLASRFDPAVAPAGSLAWLASWVALELPAGTSVPDQRALLADAHRLYERRATPTGLRELVRLYTGIGCEIVEHFRERPLWVLGGPAGLGFDTGLTAALPDGWVVPGPSVVEPALQGLASETFFDDHLGVSAEAAGRGGDRCTPHVAHPIRIDPDGTFPNFAVPTQPPGGPTLRAFSVAWTGMLRALYSELYTFSFAGKGGARVSVDGELVIDSWIDPTDERRGSMPLKAGRWVPVRIEFWSADLTAGAPRFSWASRSQLKQAVPRACLYAIDDDNVDPDTDRHDGTPGPLVVGESVVGAQGPLAVEDFGAPLFSETAHAFTVRVQARDARKPGALDALRAVLDAEKPAHTAYHLCVVEPCFRVGQQATLGVDALVAAPEPPGRLDQSALDVDARLGVAVEHADGSPRVEETLHIGSDAILR